MPAPDYLICIDFEATCYPSKTQRNNGWYQEIIDFGAVLVDLWDGEIMSSFQSFVNPTEFYLTAGCIKKLNICQGAVENSSALPEVLNKFGRWMKGIRNQFDLSMPWHYRHSDENAYFCTWSNMDLGFYLRNECERKGLSYANYLKWWINGQQKYQDHCGRNAKLHDAAFLLDTPIVGDAHNALDDSKTLAYLMYKLVSNTSFHFNVRNCR